MAALRLILYSLHYTQKFGYLIFIIKCISHNQHGLRTSKVGVFSCGDDTTIVVVRTYELKVVVLVSLVLAAGLHKVVDFH